MLKAALLILALLTAVSIAVVVVVFARKHTHAARERQDARRKRFALADTGERVALAPERIKEVPAAALEELLPPAALDASRPNRARLPGSRAARHAPVSRNKVTGRLVNTPDGEMILTTPPFALRDSIFSQKIGRFVNGIARRSPAWVVVCPKVRLDTLVTPTSPDGRDPADWRDWRRRVRMRSVDLVIVDRRSWKPLLAVVFTQQEIDVRAAGGGVGGGDRIIDEVLHHVGLPFLRLAGDFERDWPTIKPYIEETIMPHVSEEQVLEEMNRTARVDPDAAVTLLRMDGQKGWLLE